MNNVLSTTTKRLCKCIVPSGSTYVNDYSFNVVYFITSNKCKHLKILTKDSIDRNSTAYSFCKILNTNFSKGYCKDSPYTVNIIESLEGSGCTDRNAMDFAVRPIRKAKVI